MSRFLLACDKFKGSLSSQEVNQSISEGIVSVLPDAELRSMPVADGGQGMISALKETLNLEILTLSCRDPLNRYHKAVMAWDSKHKHIYLESSEATGLHFLKPSEYDPLNANTQGVGDLLLAAMELKPQHIFMGLGSSATCDGGLGALMSLGWEFYDVKGQKLPPTALSLKEISSLQAPESVSIPLSLILDVNNPPVGPRGGIQVYGPQKGANPEQLQILEQGMQNWVHFWEAQTQKELRTLKGGGAAGCLSLGLFSALACRFLEGAPWMLTQLNFESKLDWADVVITGEGAFDRSSLDGKIPGVILQRTLDMNKPSILVCGQINAELPELSTYALRDYHQDSAKSAELSQKILRQIGQTIAKAYV